MAGEYDGVDDNIDTGAGTIFNGLTSFTAFGWVNLDILTADQFIYGEAGLGLTDSSWGFLFDDVGTASGRTDIYSTFITNGVDNAVGIEGATDSAVSGSFQSVATTFLADDATGLTLFIDGSEDANSPADTTGFNDLPDVTGTVTIGALHVSSLIPLNGAIAWASAWNSVLSDEKIAALNRGANPWVVDHDNLIACYPQNNPDNLGEDISDNRIAGTVTGVVLANRGPSVEPLENFI